MVEEKNSRVENHKRSWRLGLRLAQILISVVLVGYLLWKIDIRTVPYHLQNVTMLYVWLAGLLFLLAMLARSFRWHVILQSIELQSSVLSLVLIIFESLFFSWFLPGIVGGELSRIYEVTRDTQDMPRVAVSVAIDRLVGMVVTCVFGLVALCVELYTGVGWSILQVMVSGLLFVALVAILGILCRLVAARLVNNRKSQLVRLFEQVHLFKAVGQAYQSLSLLRHQKMALSLASLYSSLFFLFNVLQTHVMIKATGIDVPLLPFFIAVPVISIIVMLPISIKGMGLREVLLLYFLSPYGVTNLHIVMFFGIGIAITVISTIMGAGVYVYRTLVATRINLR